MTNNELKLKNYGEYISFLEKLTIKEARNIYSRFLICQNKEEKDKLRTRLIEGTLYLVYDFLKSSILTLLDSRYYDIDDIISFTNEYLVMEIDHGFLKNNNSFRSIFNNQNYYEKLRESLLGDEITVEKTTFFEIENLIEMLIYLSNSFNEEFILLDDFIRRCLYKKYIVIKEKDSLGNIMYENNRHDSITIEDIRENYNIIYKIFKLLQDNNIKLNKENYKKYLSFLINFSLEGEMLSAQPSEEYYDYDMIDGICFRKVLELYHSKTLTKKTFDALKQYYGIEHSLKGNIPFKKMLEYAYKFKKVNGHTNIPEEFRTFDGPTYHPDGLILLGKWLAMTKSRTDPDSEKGKALKKLGVSLEKRNEKSFEQGFTSARNFYIKYGHLRISKDYIDKNGYKLGIWIKNRRHNTDPNSNNGKMLTLIGMIWGYEANKKRVKEICIQYLIHYDRNIRILENISVQELISKIEFLKEFKQDIINRNGVLHEIFYLSYDELKERYNVTPEELIKRYYLKEKELKLVRRY